MLAAEFLLWATAERPKAARTRTETPQSVNWAVGSSQGPRRPIGTFSRASGAALSTWTRWPTISVLAEVRSKNRVCLAATRFCLEANTTRSRAHTRRRVCRALVAFPTNLHYQQPASLYSYRTYSTYAEFDYTSSGVGDQYVFDLKICSCEIGCLMILAQYNCRQMSKSMKCQRYS